jgi:hypothetical protein
MRRQQSKNESNCFVGGSQTCHPENLNFYELQECMASPERVLIIFSILEPGMINIEFAINQSFSVGETGITVVQHKPS